MAEPAITIRTVKAPRWIFGEGIDLQPKIDDTLTSVSTTLHQRQGKGLGAKRNEVVLSSSLGARRIESTRIYPRTKGTSWTANAEYRFQRVAPNAVRKYIVKPLEAEWTATS